MFMRLSHMCSYPLLMIELEPDNLKLHLLLVPVQLLAVLARPSHVQEDNLNSINTQNHSGIALTSFEH